MPRARLLGIALGLLLGALSPAARAQTASPLTIEALPLLGSGSPAVDGWGSTLVRLENTGSAPLSGTLELIGQPAWGRSGTKNVTRAPFSVAAKGRVLLQLPSHGFGGGPPTLKVRAHDTAGALLVEAAVGELRPHDPLVFDLSVPSRTAPALRGMSVVLRRSPHGGSMTTPLISVSTPQINGATGQPILPELSAGYASATLVLATGRQLAGLEPREAQALSDWVLAGGALAVALDRPEDLRSPLIEALIGGPPLAGPAPSALGREALFVVPGDSAVISPSRPGSHGTLVHRRATPASESREKLAGYSGGNLRESPFGATASYGLGELHLLAFQPNAEPFVADPWVQLKLAELVRHAWERRASIALPHAETTLADTGLNAIRRELDPNEGTRWTVIVSALLLLIYAALAGPLNFHLASRKGRPLRALLYLPIWASAALGLIVLLGTLGKGIEGRSRRLTLIEAGAGMGRAAATRFRGLYASSASELVVRAGGHNGVLDVTGDAEETGRTVVVDRDGARLEGLRAKPWEVVVVREDGFAPLGGGVSLVRDREGVLTVKNRTARDLLGVIVLPPGKNAVYFRRIKDGAAASVRDGQTLYGIHPGPSYGSPFKPLGSSDFKGKLNGDVEGLGSAWEALEASLYASLDWWPEDVPVLIAQIDGGEGKIVDSGLRVEEDRVLIRVVGYGGVL